MKPAIREPASRPESVAPAGDEHGAEQGTWRTAEDRDHRHASGPERYLPHGRGDNTGQRIQRLLVTGDDRSTRACCAGEGRGRAASGAQRRRRARPGLEERRPSPGRDPARGPRRPGASRRRSRASSRRHVARLRHVAPTLGRSTPTIGKPRVPAPGGARHVRARRNRLVRDPLVVRHRPPGRGGDRAGLGLRSSSACMRSARCGAATHPGGLARVLPGPSLSMNR